MKKNTSYLFIALAAVFGLLWNFAKEKDLSIGGKNERLLLRSSVNANLFQATENENTIKQKLIDRISAEIEGIRQSKKEGRPEFTSPALHITRRDWEKILNEQQKQLNNLLALINKTSEEKIPEAIAERFLEEHRYIDQFPPLESYIFVLGERIIPPFSEKYDKAGWRAKEKMLGILGQIGSRNALPVVRKALGDPNQRVILHAQTALRFILALEAKPELEKMLIETRSSWALKHTLREISIIGGMDWYHEFFRLTKSRKISLSDLGIIGNPEDCPEDVIGENMDTLMKIIASDNEPVFYPSDIHSHLLGEFLMLLKEGGGGKSVLFNDVISNFEPQLLESIREIADATELTGQHEKGVVAALNMTKENLWLYPHHAAEIELNNPVLIDMIKDLLERKIFLNTSMDNWKVKDSLSAQEQEDIKWFNIYLLNQEFFLILSKDKYRISERALAGRMLSKLNQRIYLRKLYPLLTRLLHGRFGWGGTTKGFSSSVTKPADHFAGFRDDEADLILNNIAAKLQAEDIKEWIERDSSDLLTLLFLQDLSAKLNGADVDFREKVFTFMIETLDQSGNSLASAVFQLNYGQEQSVILPSVNRDYPDHNIKLKVQLDRNKWLFHFDSILIDLKPYGAGFKIYIPIAGSNETPLTETFAGQKEKINWRFEHLAEDVHDGSMENIVYALTELESF